MSYHGTSIHQLREIYSARCGFSEKYCIVDEGVLKTSDLRNNPRSTRLHKPAIHSNHSITSDNRTTTSRTVDVKADVHVWVWHQNPVSEIADLQGDARIQVRLKLKSLRSDCLIDRMIRKGVSGSGFPDARCFP